MSRIPGINNFVQEQARPYDATRHGEVPQCAICLENFSETDGKQVAELNCSAKHIFHADCLKEWLKNNDTCPMCREPVISA